MWSISWIRFPSPTPNVVVLHSPTPSSVRMAASSNGLGKKALAAWLSWWSVKTRRARVGFPSALRMVRRMCSLSLSQSGIARRKLRNPAGA